MAPPVCHKHKNTVCMLYAILFILRSDPESAEEDETVSETPDVCHCVILNHEEPNT